MILHFFHFHHSHFLSLLQPVFLFFSIPYTPTILPIPFTNALPSLFAFLPSLFSPSPLFPIVWINLKLLNDEDTALFACLNWWRERDKDGEREFWRTCFALCMFPLLLPTIIHSLSLEFIGIWTVISSGELGRDGWSRERRRQNVSEGERTKFRQTHLQHTLGAGRRSGED